MVKGWKAFNWLPSPLLILLYFAPNGVYTESGIDPLKEKFYEFMASENSVQAKERLRAFRLFAFTSDLPEFKACLTMLQNWEPYILNAFDCRYSNGFTEGMNNTIKVIKRIAYGYRNFENFRHRILVTVNTKMEPITSS